MIAFTGRCLVHRAEILQLDGSWPDALEAARLAGQRFVETKNPAAGLAHYRQGELLRLQGEFERAEEAYREASRFGWEPHPGLAQLRLAQGRSDAAVAAIRRANAETTAPLKRAGLLPAYVEIVLSVGEIEERARCVPRSSSRSRRATRARCSAPWLLMRGERSSWRWETPALPSSRCAVPPRSGRRSRRRTSPRGHAR